MTRPPCYIETLALLLATACLGCQSETATPNSAQSTANATAASDLQNRGAALDSIPTTATLDTTAVAEIRSAGVEAWRQTRFRFRAKAISLWAAERNTLNMLMATAESPNLGNAHVLFRSQQEKDRMILHELNLYEGVVDRLSSAGEPLLLKDCVVVADRREWLAGSWRVTAIIANGQPVDSTKVESLQLRYQFADDKITIARADSPAQSYTYHVAENDRFRPNPNLPAPREIILNQSPPVKGIFAFPGDEMQLCVRNDRAGEFPAELASTSTSKTDLLTLKLEVPPLPRSTLSAAPENDAKDQRTRWHYINAPKLFPDQTVTEGTFRQTQGSDQWWEDRVGGPAQDWVEKDRTREYVELARPVGDFRVRLYDTRSTYRFGYDKDWREMFAGKWE